MSYGRSNSSMPILCLSSILGKRERTNAQISLFQCDIPSFRFIHWANEAC